MLDSLPAALEWEQVCVRTAEVRQQEAELAQSRLAAARGLVIDATVARIRLQKRVSSTQEADRG